MGEPAAVNATISGFELYDADTDPRVIAANKRTDSDLTALAASAPAAQVVAQVPEAPVSKHPQFLVLKAKQAGFSGEDIAPLSEGELRELLAEASVQRVESRGTGAPNGAAADPLADGEGPGEAVVAPVPAAPVVNQRDVLIAKLKATVDEDVANAVVEYLDGTLSQLTTRLETAEGHVKSVLPFVRKKSAEEYDNLVDQGFGDLGPAFEKVFGKGGVHDLDRSSPQFRRRLRLVQTLRANPPKDGNIRKAIVAAGTAEYGDMVGAAQAQVPETPQPVRVAPKRFTERDYEDAALVTPSGRSPAPEPPGRNKAIQGVREFQAKTGEEPDDINSGEDKFL